MVPETVQHPLAILPGMDTKIDDRLTPEEQAIVDKLDLEMKRMTGGDHYDLVTRIYIGLRAMFAPRAHEVLVTADLPWFDPDGHLAGPDIVVTFGVPQQHLSSYRQDRGMPAPTVAIEVVSAKDTQDDNYDKLRRLERLGVVEAWVLYVKTGGAICYRLNGKDLEVDDSVGNVSPALGGVRFANEHNRVVPYFPDGTMFPEDLTVAMTEARKARDAERAALERVAALEARLRAAGIDPGEV